MTREKALELYKLLIASLKKKWNNPDEANDIEKVLFHHMNKEAITPEFLPIFQLDELTDEICENRANYIKTPVSKKRTVLMIISLLQQFRCTFPDESIAFAILEVFSQELNEKELLKMKLVDNNEPKI